MPQIQKIWKIASKIWILRSRFFNDFWGCKKSLFLSILDPKTERRHHTFWLFLKYFPSFSFVWVLSAILFDFMAKRPKMSKNGGKKTKQNKNKNKPTHQPRHQFLTTSATPPAANQQGFTNCPDLPMASSPTLPIEWAGGGAGSAGSICNVMLFVIC